MEVFGYEYKPRVTISGWELRRISLGSPPYTVDLGLRTVGRDIRALLGQGSAWQWLDKPSKLRGAYVLGGSGELTPVEVRGRHYYKLVQHSEGSPPTIELDGVHMHRVEGIDPWRDSRVKVRVARVRKGHAVLDICTGLGYTAVNAVKLGARLVHTIEVDENVLWIAERNPWSRGLADGRITIIVGDAVEVADDLPPGYYDVVIHDPPRYSKETGELYSEGFHEKLFKLLKPGGTLYHYTGEPGRVRGLNMPGRIASKLKRVGFTRVRYISEAQGLVARKP